MPFPRKCTDGLTAFLVGKLGHGASIDNHYVRYFTGLGTIYASLGKHSCNS